MVVRAKLLALTAAAALLPTHTFAEVMHEPLWVENLSPLAQLIAIPSQRSADVRAGLSLTWHSDVATHFVSQASLDERVFFDGETQKHSLALRWGLSSNWDISATLPVVKHSGGFVDSYVNRWHDFFGMSDGYRGSCSISCKATDEGVLESRGDIPASVIPNSSVMRICSRSKVLIS